MRIRIVCWAHDVEPVISAGDPILNFVKDGKKPEYELDEANLYCTGGEGDHDFHVEIDMEDGHLYSAPLHQPETVGQYAQRITGA